MSHQNACRITVQTCTYNRASTLHRVYESLQSQTFRDFEWLVYNNGSSDNTEALVKQWAEEADFPIRYLFTTVNAGIQNAFNVTAEAGVGEFWVNMDSDDGMVPEALERLIGIWESIPADEQPNFSGVTVNCIDQHGQLVGNPFPSSPLDSTSTEVNLRYRVHGEKFGMIRRDVLLEIPFQSAPEHIQPLAIWGMIGRKYKTRYVNESLRIYYIDESDRDDQLSRNRSKATLALNAFGGRVNTRYRLEHELSYFRYAPADFLKNAIFYKRYSEALDIGVGKQLSDLSSLGGKALLIAAYPADFLYKLVN